jgi:hypothetical protein
MTMPSNHPIARHLRQFNAEIAILSFTVGTLVVVLAAILTR